MTYRLNEFQLQLPPSELLDATGLVGAAEVFEAAEVLTPQGERRTVDRPGSPPLSRLDFHRVRLGGA